MRSARPSEGGFTAVQYAIAAHIRDPEHVAAPAHIEPRRMAIYRELIYNNVESFLSGNFPVIRRITPDDRWQAMVRDFFITHRCHTPYFTRIAPEFIAWLETERAGQDGDHPFLAELARYEWLELELSLDEREADAVSVNAGGDLLEGHPVLSPLARLLTCRWPVQRIGPDHLPDAAPEQPTHLLVWRDRGDQVHFMELAPASHRALALLAEDPLLSGRDALLKATGPTAHPERVLAFGRDFLDTLRAKDVILGTSG